MAHRPDPARSSASSASGNRSVAARDIHGSTIITGDVHFSTLGTLAWDCSVRIANFLGQYIGAPDEPVTFGGRDGELAALSAWLADPSASPYLLFAAPAGRGKSALLAQWIHTLRLDGDAEADGTRIIFFPVSIRYRTNLAGVVFPMLATQLAKLHGEEVGGKVPLTPEVWRGLVGEYLSRPLPQGRRLLLVLDGLDEAADWKPGPDLLPMGPPAGLRVVASARLTSAAPTPRAWVERLGWNVPRLATTPELPPLTAASVADVLRHVGFGLPDPAQHQLLVNELHRLSEGDPLLVRLYVDELRRGTPRPEGLSPEELAALDPGLEGFFNRWWHDQRLLWDHDVPLRESAVRTLLNLLACALAPLRQADLLRLAPEEPGLETFALEDTLRPLERYVVGDGRSQGYVFAHPKLGQYFYERLVPAERAKWDQRFLAWGREVLAALENGEPTSAQVPMYLLQYLGVHIERAGAPVDELLALVTRPWFEAWLQGAAEIAGFLADVGRAWRAAGARNADMAARGKPPPYLGEEVLCALCVASDRSRARKVSPVLLEALVESGMWTALEGLVYARRFSPTPRAAIFAKLIPHFPPDEQVRLLREAFLAARSVATKAATVHALCAHWTRLAPAQRPPLQDDALWLASRVSLPSERIKTLALLIPALSAEASAAAVQEARELATRPRSIIERAEGLARIAEVAPQAARDLITALLEEAEWAEYGGRLRVAAALLPSLEPDLKSALVAALMAGARAGVHSEYDARPLSLVVPHAPEPQRRELSILLATWLWDEPHSDPYRLSQILGHIARYLPPDMRSTLANKASELLSISNLSDYCDMLDFLLANLPEQERGVVLQREAAAGRAGLRHRLAQLAVLRYLPHEERVGLVGVFRETDGIRLDEAEMDAGLWQRVGPSIREAGVRDTSVHAEIEARLQISDKRGMVAALGAVLPLLAAGARERVEGVVLRTVADLQPNQQNPQLVQLLASGRGAGKRLITDAPSVDRGWVLARLAHTLSPAGLRTALGIADAFAEPGEKAMALAGILPHLSPKARVRVARRFWHTVIRIEMGRSDLDGKWRLRIRDRRRANLLDQRLARLLLVALPNLPHPEREHAVTRLMEIAGRLTTSASRMAVLLRTLPCARGGQRATIVSELAVELFQESILGRRERPTSAAARARLASVMGGPEAAAVLEHARQIPRLEARAGALAALVPWLDTERRVRVAAEAVTLARRLPTCTQRAALWYGVGVNLPDPSHAAAVLRRAWHELTPEFGDTTLRLSIQVALVPHLPENERQRQLAEVVRLAKGTFAVPVPLLHELAAHLPESVAREMVEHVCGPLSGTSVEDKVALRTWRDATGFEQLLGEVRRSVRPREMPPLLAALVPHVRDSLTTPERLAVNRYAAIARKPRPFSDEELQGLDDTILVLLAQGGIGVASLAEAAQVLSRRPLGEQYRVLHERLSAAARHSRMMVLRVIRSHARLMAAQDRACLPHIVDAVLKVQQWWP